MPAANCRAGTASSGHCFRGSKIMNRGGSGIVGFLFFIGIIVLLNVLSYVFNWGWYFY
jgi:hypothetical protein